MSTRPWIQSLAPQKEKRKKSYLFVTLCLFSPRKTSFFPILTIHPEGYEKLGNLSKIPWLMTKEARIGSIIPLPLKDGRKQSHAMS